MKDFFYEGTIPASKSHMNRALICASYSPAIKLVGESSCDDVVKMKEALSILKENSHYKNLEFDCGAAGTVLRFLAMRVSRIPGRHKLKGTERLMARPQEELELLFKQLGVSLLRFKDHMIIEGNGWHPHQNVIKINRNISSQFASGVLLNCWELEFPLTLRFEGEGVSEGYWQLTKKVVEDFGMKFSLDHENALTIQANAKTNILTYQVESDLSSAFAIAAYATLNGKAIFQHFPFSSLQPDIAFVDILKKMGANIVCEKDKLIVEKAKQLKSVHVNLLECPDLFPVLSVLCAFADGVSILDGAPHLIYKESNRIEKSAELIHHLGADTEKLGDGMVIKSKLKDWENLLAQKPFKYDTDHDHRLAFAASLLKSKNLPIDILTPEVVNKSFPEFWSIVK